MKKVAITGMGAISSAGMNVLEHWQSMQQSKVGVKPLTRLGSTHVGKLPVGEVPAADEELHKRAHVDGIWSRTGLLAVNAISETIQSIPKELVEHPKTALISGTTVGGMDLTEQWWFKEVKGEWSGDHELSKDALLSLAEHPDGEHTEKIAQQLNMRGFRTTLSTACSSAANAILLGKNMIQSGMADRAIVGGTDALSLFTLNGFKSLMIVDEAGIRPFSEERKGMNLGEGAGYLFLEAENLIADRPVLGYVSGGGNTCDAYHPTASSPHGDGAAKAMTQAIHDAGIDAEDIGYLKAHGTATKNNDLTEGKAIEKVFGEHVPPVSSTKAMTGHTLAASGGIEAVFCLLALQNGLLPANVNLKTPIKELSFTALARNVEKKIRYAMLNAFGFGGNNTSLIFSTGRS